MSEQALFYTKNRLLFPGTTAEALLRMREALFTELGLLPCQVIEAASYSLAMVVRFALGLSASGGKTCVLAADHLSGWIAIATMRHLVNASAQAELVFVLPSDANASAELERQLKPLEKAGIPMCVFNGSDDSQALNDMVNSAHNVICGLFDLNVALSTDQSVRLNEVISILNESKTPVHTIEAPLGIDVNNGTAASCPLFASSTLSLGAPLTGLFAGSEYVGRHYLCDTSLSKALYTRDGPDLSAVFAEQPVVQIFPHRPDEVKEDLDIDKGDKHGS